MRKLLRRLGLAVLPVLALACSTQDYPAPTPEPTPAADVAPAPAYPGPATEAPAAPAETAQIVVEGLPAGISVVEMGEGVYPAMLAKKYPGAHTGTGPGMYVLFKVNRPAITRKVDGEQTEMIQAPFSATLRGSPKADRDGYFWLAMAGTSGESNIKVAVLPAKIETGGWKSGVFSDGPSGSFAIQFSF